MSISDIRAREKLGALEQVAVNLTADIFKLIDSDAYMDQLEDLVDMSDLDFDEEGADDILCKRLDTVEEKVILRSARALLNFYTGKDDKVAELATRAGNIVVDRR